VVANMTSPEFIVKRDTELCAPVRRKYKVKHNCVCTGAQMEIVETKNEKDYKVYKS